MFAGEWRWRIPVRSISAMLSQLLVAFTVELDNQFELRMAQAGHPGSRLSLVVWMGLVRFLVDGEVSIRDLAARAVAPESQVKFQLGCLERWGFVALLPEPSDGPPAKRREGWGCGRGIRSGWMVRLSPKGQTAVRVWTPLMGEIERCWENRFGADDVHLLRQSLREIVRQLEVNLPLGLPHSRLPLPALLSQLLLAFRIEFERDSSTSLVLCANALRILGPEPAREAEIPRLTGGSPETSGIGWQIKPYIVVTPDPAKRGKLVRLSPRGLRAQQMYQQLTHDIEQRWEARFGRDAIVRLRECLERFFERRGNEGPLLSEGLIPPPGTVRAGVLAPALGRRDIGTAARQRMRDLVAQTEAFVRDPAAALPHYPMWDMNRGFGP